jgi:fumarate hydratase class I
MRARRNRRLHRRRSASGYVHAKELCSALDDVNPDRPGARSVNHGEVNKLDRHHGVRRTCLAHRLQDRVRIASRPALCVVAYDCWAFRRLGVVLDARRAGSRAGAKRSGKPDIAMADQEGFRRTGREAACRSPLTEEQVRSLKVGEGARVRAAYTDQTPCTCTS